MSFIVNLLQMVHQKLHQLVRLFVFRQHLPLVLVELLLEVLEDLDQVVFVLCDYVSDALFSVLKGHYEEREQHEQLFLDAFLVVRQTAQLLHDVLQVLLVVHKVIRELRVQAHLGHLLLAVHVALVLVILLPLFLAQVVFQAEGQNLVLQLHALSLEAVHFGLAHLPEHGIQLIESV